MTLAHVVDARPCGCGQPHCASDECGGAVWPCPHIQRHLDDRALEQLTRSLNAAFWHARTGHCYGCGQPDVACRCTPRNPCPCHDLHPMGGGLEPDAIDKFRVPIDQDALW